MIKRIQELEFKRTLTALIYGQKGAGKMKKHLPYFG